MKNPNTINLNLIEANAEKARLAEQNRIIEIIQVRKYLYNQDHYYEAISEAFEDVLKKIQN